MRASYQWLRELLPALSLGPEEVAKLLTSAGLEVEGTRQYGEASRDVIVAEVISSEPHPSRDKLKLVELAVGEGRTQRIVCGAPNVPTAGGLVVLAPLGTHLPAVNMTMEPREIAGVRSEGMLASERELGLRDSHDGILVLPPDTASPGTRLCDAIPASFDHIFDINVTANRPDALGHVGLARELAALSRISWPHPPPVQPFVRWMPAHATEIELATIATIDVQDAERCPRYGAAFVDEVRVGPSPRWLAWRLEALGFRSISNVVDVTNYIQLEYGHPIHAFDVDRIRGKKLTVRRAAEQETLTLLDDRKKQLVADDLVIADGEGPVALAGAMGGEGSGIHDFTSRVLVECAYFQSRGVRRTGRRHGVHTESSHRFERGVDPSDIEEVLVATCALLADVASGTPSRITNVIGELSPRSTIRLRADSMNQLLGMHVDLGEAVQILERLGCSTLGFGYGEARMVPPHHRPDLAIEADLIEEVVRVRGLDTLPSSLPAIRPQAPRVTSQIGQRARRAAVEIGLSEAIAYAFVDPKDLEIVRAPKAAFTLENPLGEERSAMRTSLLPNLLEALRRARRHGAADVRLFSVASTFFRESEMQEGTELGQPWKLPPELPVREAQTFTAVIAGNRDGWLDKPQAVDVWDAKGIALAMVERATGHHAEVVSFDGPRQERARTTSLEDLETPLHPRGAADIVVAGTVVGRLGPLHPTVRDKADLGCDALIVEIDLDALEALGTPARDFKPIPLLPPVTRDLALVVSDDVLAGSVEQAIRQAGGDLCEEVRVFDLFRGGAIPEGHRSLAFHVVYRDPKATSRSQDARTLTDAEVDARHATVVKAVGQAFGATLRG